MSTPAAKPQVSPAGAAPRGGFRGAAARALPCAIAGFAVFQWFGSAAQGYVRTHSLFRWWIGQWIDPNAETQHGWLILGISVWLAARNCRGRLRGERTGDVSRLGSAGVPRRAGEEPAAGIREPEGGASTVAVSRGANPFHAGDGAVPGRELRRESAAGSSAWIAPLGAMLAGLALHALGFAAEQARISIVGFLLFAWGVVRFAGGRRRAAATAFPLAFLVFAIPLNMLDSVGFWLRMWVVDAAAWIAHAAGIGVLRNGTMLAAPDGRYNYDVAAACSGVRSLMALSALSLLIGYLGFASYRRRVLPLLFCFPLVYAGNVIRIGSIIFAAQLGGPKWGGRAHEIMGYLVFVIVLGGVLAGVSVVRRGWPERAPAARSVSADGGFGPRAGSRSAVIVTAVVLVACGAEILYLRRLETMPPRGRTGVFIEAGGRNPVELPMVLNGGWVGFPAAVTPVERQVLPPDTGFSRVLYVGPGGRRRVFVSIVLSGRDRTSIHRPELCLVGQGWTIVGRGSCTFSYPGYPDAAFPATLLRVRHRATTAGGDKVVPQLVAYWFVCGDRVVATNWQRFLVDAWNRVVHARVDRWAYVLVQTDASDGYERATARIRDVLEASLPAFQRPIPILAGNGRSGETVRPTAPRSGPAA